MDEKTTLALLEQMRRIVGELKGLNESLSILARWAEQNWDKPRK